MQLYDTLRRIIKLWKIKKSEKLPYDPKLLKFLVNSILMKDFLCAKIITETHKKLKILYWTSINKI